MTFRILRSVTTVTIKLIFGFFQDFGSRFFGTLKMLVDIIYVDVETLRCLPDVSGSCISNQVAHHDHIVSNFIAADPPCVYTTSAAEFSKPNAFDRNSEARQHLHINTV
jgi:hypothetical protein